MKILNRVTGALLYEGEHETMKECVEAAVKARADLTAANLAGANLTGANLAYANLTAANLAGADLSAANLSAANLSAANLAGANLTDANLTDADLSAANLADADLTAANLADANLTGADLTGAYLADADLTGAGNVGEANGSEAKLADRLERQRLRAVRFRERNPDVPVVEALDAKMLAVIESGSGKLDMSSWHKCETTHCRAGWAITLAGEAGKALETKYGPQRAGSMIYRASTGRVPHFFAGDERAMEDIRACAAEQL